MAYIELTSNQKPRPQTSVNRGWRRGFPYAGLLRCLEQLVSQRDLEAALLSIRGDEVIARRGLELMDVARRD